MRLTEKEQAMLNGEMGPGFARAMRVLVGIGKAFGAERMVPISRGHISLSNQEGDLWFVSKLLEEQAGEKPLRREGYRDGTWVLLDYGCICVHVFSAEARSFYDLERLWADGKPLDLTGVLTQD